MALPRDMDRIKKFANWFKQAMEDVGYTSQRKFSLSSHVSTATISRILNYGQLPDDETIKKMAPALHKSVNEVMLAAGYPVGDNIGPQPKQLKHPKDLRKVIDEAELQLDGEPLTEDDREKLRKAIELLFWDAKAQNKRKK